MNQPDDKSTQRTESFPANVMTSLLCSYLYPVDKNKQTAIAGLILAFHIEM